MSKLLKAQEEMDHNKQRDHLFVPGKTENSPNPATGTAQPEKEPKSSPSIVPAAAAVQKRQILEQKSGFKLALLVTCLVAFFGLTLLILNLKLMDELKIGRQSSLQLAGNLQALESRVSKLEVSSSDFKKQTQQETENFRDRLMEIKDTMAGYNTSLADIVSQLTALKEGINSIKGSLDENRTQLKTISDNNVNMNEKLKNLDNISQNLRNQYDELRGMLRLSAEPK